MLNRFHSTEYVANVSLIDDLSHPEAPAYIVDVDREKR